MALTSVLALLAILVFAPTASAAMGQRVAPGQALAGGGRAAGEGYTITGFTNQGAAFLGPLNDPTGGPNWVWCTNVGLNIPSGGVTSVETVTDADAAMVAWLTYQLQYDPGSLGVGDRALSNAAGGAIVHLLYEQGSNGVSAEQRKAALRSAMWPALSAEVDRLLDLARASVNLNATTEIQTYDLGGQRTGVISNLGLRNGRGEYIAGVPFTSTLTTGAVFDTNGNGIADPGETSVYSGTTPGHAFELRWVATAGVHDVRARTEFRVDRRRLEMRRTGASTQDVLGPTGTDPVIYPSGGVQFRAVGDFQPTIASQLSTRYADKNELVRESVIVGLNPGDVWSQVGGQGVSVRVDGAVYGPLDGEKPFSSTVPAGTPLAGTFELDVNGPGSYNVNWTSPTSATYAFVWQIRKDATPNNQMYVRASVSDGFMAPSEIVTVRMTPQLRTQVRDRLVDDPNAPLVDAVTVSLPGSDVWPADASGNPLPLVQRNTVYGPFNVPTPPRQNVPAGAPVYGTEMLTFYKAGTKPTSGAIRRGPDGAFYTWVAEVRMEDQSPAMQQVLAGPVRDWFMLETETTSARHHIKHYSEVREYNVVRGGRAFDRIDIDGYPEDHGTFQGIGGWKPDLGTAEVTVYRRDTPFTTVEVPDDAEAVKTITVPAKNGTYNIGYVEADAVFAERWGHYVFVYSFAGDDRVAPFTSAANDIREQFYVPPDGADRLWMTSTATTDAVAGEGTIEDLVLINGTPPAGATLEWQTCMVRFEHPFTCPNPVTTYSTPVDGPGFYKHPPFPTPTLADFPAGELTASFGWAPILRAANGDVLLREPFGTPAQVTTIRAEVPPWSSQATPTAKVGDETSDVVTFDGPTRSDWTVQWQAAWLDEDDNPIEGTVVDVGEPVAVDPENPTVTSPTWTVEVPADTKPGTTLRRGWQPILFDGVGRELKREPWGTTGQVTVVDYPLPTMTSRATPSGLLGEVTQDSVTITGPVREGSRLIWSACYYVEAEDTEAACRPDATPVPDGPVLEDGSVGLVLPALGVGEEFTAESPEHELTAGGLVPDLGLRFTWVPRVVDTDDEVLVQERVGEPSQTTTVKFPPIKATTTAYHVPSDPAQQGPVYGDAIGDRVVVDGDILPGDSVTVRLYAWERGTPPLCTGTPLAEVELELVAGTATYDTGAIYTTSAKRTNLIYGFQETTVSRGKAVVSECGLAAETVDPRTPPTSGSSEASAGDSTAKALAVTGFQRWGLLFLGAGLIAFGWGSVAHARARKTQVA
ncbi:hypothetical protein [Cellulomonas sp. HD19AZ1]|uniref:hypothetical protein n=1 Tax=Cellulomonas sp. HD19AZ1 TaxID=2559593 RepID=UPI001070EB83|nr:hypothetical protein [Cellulomonas sp. HD19AZ1]TFH68123.1 hypothetical protein E4A51_17925 [Cellulomonas sp. HD19AZ1]